MNPTKDRMNLIFVCTKCTYYWRKEKPAEGQEVKYSDDDEDDQWRCDVNNKCGWYMYIW